MHRFSCSRCDLTSRANRPKDFVCGRKVSARAWLLGSDLRGFCHEQLGTEVEKQIVEQATVEKQIVETAEKQIVEKRRRSQRPKGARTTRRQRRAERRRRAKGTDVTGAASSLSFLAQEFLCKVSLTFAVTQTEVQRQTKMKKDCKRSLLIIKLC